MRFRASVVNYSGLTDDVWKLSVEVLSHIVAPLRLIVEAQRVNANQRNLNVHKALALTPQPLPLTLILPPETAGSEEIAPLHFCPKGGSG